MIPNVSKRLGLPVSQYIPLVSSVPLKTLSSRLGVRPAWPETGAVSRKVNREPIEIGFLEFLTSLFALPVTWPLLPAKAVAWVADSVEQMATRDQDLEADLEEERLSLMMRREMGQVTEEEFKERMTEIERKIKEAGVALS